MSASRFALVLIAENPRILVVCEQQRETLVRYLQDSLTRCLLSLSQVESNSEPEIRIAIQRERLRWPAERGDGLSFIFYAVLGAEYDPAICASRSD